MRARIPRHARHAFAIQHLFVVALATLVVKYTSDPRLFGNDHINSVAITSSGDAAKLTWYFKSRRT